MIRGRTIFTNDIHPYGIDIDVTTGTVTRIGDIRGHRQLPVQNAMVGGTITADGTFTPFANQSDWTAAGNQSRDGSAGNCVVKVPLHYVKYETVGTHIRAWVSHLWHQGFSVVGDYYVGAHEATINRDTGALADVVSMDAKYRGGNNQASWDGTYRTLLGKPATNISLTNFRNAARLINNGDTRHNIIPYYKYKDLVWLICTEYANLDSQADFNPNLDVNGCKQGGLGLGVSIGIDWAGKYSYQPFIPCGVSDTLGNNSGVVSYISKDDDDNILYTFSVNRYRGIELPFGHLHKIVDGILCNVISDEDGNYFNNVYTASNPMLFADDISNYDYLGNEYRANLSGIRNVFFGANGDIIIKEGGNMQTNDVAETQKTDILRRYIYGGSAGQGFRCGIFSYSAFNNPSTSSITIGSRYCYIP